MKILCDTGAIKCDSFDLKELFVNQENIISENGLHNLENALHSLIYSSTCAAPRSYSVSSLLASIERHVFLSRG